MICRLSADYKLASFFMNVLYISENQLVKKVPEYDMRAREEETARVAVAFPWTPQEFWLGL